MAAFEAATHREVLNARYGCRSSPEDGQVGRHLAVGEKAGLAHTPHELYTPHLTLLYDPQQVPVRAVEPPLGWTAHDVVLVRSRIGRSSHEVLSRWPLRTAA